MRTTTRTFRSSRTTRAGLATAATLALALGTAACSSDTDADTAGTDVSGTDSASNTSALVLDDGWVKSSAEGMTGAFGTLRNTGAEDVHITGITSPVSTRVEMHETVPGGSGMMMQEKAGGFVVPAGGDLVLEPGGDHIMFMDLTDPVTTGQVVPLELTLDGGDELEISVTARDFKGGEEEYVGGGHGGSDAGDHGGHSGGHGEGMSHDG